MKNAKSKNDSPCAMTRLHGTHFYLPGGAEQDDRLHAHVSTLTGLLRTLSEQLIDTLSPLISAPPPQKWYPPHENSGGGNTPEFGASEARQKFFGWAPPPDMVYPPPHEKSGSLTPPDEILIFLHCIDWEAVRDQKSTENMKEGKISQTKSKKIENVQRTRSYGAYPLRLGRFRKQKHAKTEKN